MIDIPGVRTFLDILWYPKRDEPRTFYFVLKATASRIATVTVSLARTADISSWFEAGNAANHVRRVS